MTTLKGNIIRIINLNPMIRTFFLELNFLRKKINYMFYYLRSKTNSDIIVFEAYMGRQYACSPKSLYEEMCNNKKWKNKTKVWAFKNEKDFKFLENDPHTIIVKYKSKAYYMYYAKAKYWISNSRIPNEIIKKSDQVYVQCWHGTPLKKIGYDIKVYSKKKYLTKELYRNYKLDAKRFSYILSPSPYYTEKLTSAFALQKIGKSNIFIEKGYPRNDFLYTFCASNVSCIKDKLGIKSDKKIILYAPTWRETQRRNIGGYSYKVAIDFNYLYEYLHTEYIILFRSHYFIEDTKGLAVLTDFIIDVSSYNDINELYIISDLLITDYSSVFFDYAILKRPIIFFMYDLEEYKKELRDFYLELEELPGPIVQNEQALINCINQIKTSEWYISTLNSFNNKYNPHNNACSREVLEAIIKLNSCIPEEL